MLSRTLNPGSGSDPRTVQRRTRHRRLDPQLELEHATRTRTCIRILFCSRLSPQKQIRMRMRVTKWLIQAVLTRTGRDRKKPQCTCGRTLVGAICCVLTVACAGVDAETS